tara:strand:- start:215 stop:316 length:102 start_codon:yes stop_codon:yes gene_type:complete
MIYFTDVDEFIVLLPRSETPRSSGRPLDGFHSI